MKNELSSASVAGMEKLERSARLPCFIIVVLLAAAFGLTYLTGGQMIVFALIGGGDVVVLIRWKIREREIKKSNQKRIADIRSDWEQKTVQQIEAYNNQVKQYSQKALKNSASIQPMADYVTDMFKRMISHVNAAANVKYIETDFTYEVKRNEIVFYYDSNYSNSRSSYDFDANRFRNLNSDMECEGLARALSVMTTRSVIASYPPHYVVGDKIPLDHVDARVTLHFKAVNANFQTAKDIF